MAALVFHAMLSCLPSAPTHQVRVASTTEYTRRRVKKPCRPEMDVYKRCALYFDDTEEPISLSSYYVVYNRPTANFTHHHLLSQARTTSLSFERRDDGAGDDDVGCDLLPSRPLASQISRTVDYGQRAQNPNLPVYRVFCVCPSRSQTFLLELQNSVGRRTSSTFERRRGPEQEPQRFNKQVLRLVSSLPLFWSVAPISTGGGDKKRS